jgi:hypothetical protein
MSSNTTLLFSAIPKPIRNIYNEFEQIKIPIELMKKARGTILDGKIARDIYHAAAKDGAKNILKNVIRITLAGNALIIGASAIAPAIILGCVISAPVTLIAAGSALLLSGIITAITATSFLALSQSFALIAIGFLALEYHDFSFLNITGLLEPIISLTADFLSEHFLDLAANYPV